MGTNVKLLTNIFRRCLGDDPGPRRRYLDIGSQNLFGGTPEDYREFLTYFGVAPAADRTCEDLAERSVEGHPRHTSCAELFALTGWDYISIDLMAATVQADLNVYRLPWRHVRAFDFVANFGTTEHVFNQFNCFRTIHDAAKVGGFMVHFLPTSGFFYHCLFSYNPKMFLLMGQANNYRILHAGMYTERFGKLDTQHETWAEYQQASQISFPSTLAEFIFQKQSRAAFKVCYDRGETTIRHAFDRACPSLR